MAEKRLKIAFLSYSQGVTNRGAEAFVKELSNRLTDRNQVDIFTENKKLSERWPILWRFYLDPQSVSVCMFTLKNLMKIYRQKYDVVIPINGGWQPALMRIVTWLYGGKLVITGQSGKGWDDRNNLWCFPDTFVALSDRLYKWAKKVNPFIKVVKIPNGVAVEKFSKNHTNKNFKLEKPIVLTVGALDDWKRIDLTIQAVAKLKKGSLVIVGDGDKKEYLQNLASKLLPTRHIFIKANPDEMPEIYRACDLFVFSTSPDESFGIVLLEAMASGLPVVATDDPIRAEITGDAGILVDPTDTNAYAKAIKNALSKKWGNKPRKQAEKFNWNNIAKQYEKLFLDFVK